LANLIREISAAALAQSAAANQVSSTMNVIQEITSQTSSGVTATASSIGNLAEMAKEMRSTVAGFTLPESEHVIPTLESDDSGEMERAVDEGELVVKAEEVFHREQPSQDESPSIADFEVDVATSFEKDNGRESILPSADSKEDNEDNQRDDKDKRNVSAA